jgi:hypothetical protein
VQEIALRPAGLVMRQVNIEQQVILWSIKVASYFGKKK